MPMLRLLALTLILLPRGEPIHGVTISTHGIGTEWGTEVMQPTMASIKAVGANWVAIHPYAAIADSGAVIFDAFDPTDPPRWMRHPVDEAHRQGLKILIKPHLAYWGSRFGWRGEIDFSTPAAWERFWSSYSRWITSLAEACADADGFVIGTELDRTLEHADQWRRIIVGIRAVTRSPLTYAANWADFRRVTFWDQLDVIGIQGYFPVADSAADGVVEIKARWAQLASELALYAAEHNRNVVFTELGYNRSFAAAQRPWDYRTDGPEAEAVQARCLAVALAAIADEPALLGPFLWKWFPEPHPVGRTFQLATPRLKAVIAAGWAHSAPR